MKIINREEFMSEFDFYLSEIKSGKIFIYPTDTIYGIGCDARLSDSIMKIREIKNRETKPMSVIAPGKEWIRENCFVLAEEELDKLPGPYTFILDLVNRESIASNELIGNLTGIGVRIPKNWFSEFLVGAKIPFVTTSVNVSGEPHLIQREDLKKEIEEKVDYFVDSGILGGEPSTIIDLRSGEKLR